MPDSARPPREAEVVPALALPRRTAEVDSAAVGSGEQVAVVQPATPVAFSTGAYTWRCAEYSPNWTASPNESERGGFESR